MPFEVRSSHVIETVISGESPVETAERLALAKARAVATEIASPIGSATPTRLVLGADTIVVDGASLVGKPRNAAEAVALLGQLRGRWHQVITAVALVDVLTGVASVRSETTRVHLREMTDEEIASYVASGDPLDKAGGYAIQNRAFKPVESIDGCYSNVVGLPLGLVAEMIADVPVTTGRRSEISSG